MDAEDKKESFESKFEHIKLPELIDAYKSARQEQRYCLLFDSTQGNAATFFHYKARLKDFNKEIMKINKGSQTKDGAIEVLREGLMWAAKIGDTFAVNMDLFIPDWKNDFTYKDGLFNTDLIFDFKRFRKDENYKAILQKEEDIDDQNNVGCYFMNMDFQIVFIYSFQGDDHMQKVIASIPHFESSWKAFVIIQ